MWTALATALPHFGHAVATRRRVLQSSVEQGEGQYDGVPDIDAYTVALQRQEKHM